MLAIDGELMGVVANGGGLMSFVAYVSALKGSTGGALMVHG